MDTPLISILLAFSAIMAGVLGFCLRERQRATGHSEGAFDPRSDRDDDQRVALTLFGGIISGILLALLTAYLMFFRAGSGT